MTRIEAIRQRAQTWTSPPPWTEKSVYSRDEYEIVVGITRLGAQDLRDLLALYDAAKRVIEARLPYHPGGIERGETSYMIRSLELHDLDEVLSELDSPVGDEE